MLLTWPTTVIDLDHMAAGVFIRFLCYEVTLFSPLPTLHSLIPQVLQASTNKTLMLLILFWHWLQEGLTGTDGFSSDPMKQVIRNHEGLLSYWNWAGFYMGNHWGGGWVPRRPLACTLKIFQVFSKRNHGHLLEWIYIWKGEHPHIWETVGHMIWVGIEPKHHHGIKSKWNHRAWVSYVSRQPRPLSHPSLLYQHPYLSSHLWLYWGGGSCTSR